MFCGTYFVWSNLNKKIGRSKRDKKKSEEFPGANPLTPVCTVSDYLQGCLLLDTLGQN